MARPKKDPNRLDARERIMNACWDMLSEGSYEHITIAELAKRAEVNHNTFYYHFSNIDNLLDEMVKENLSTEVFSNVFSLIVGENKSLVEVFEDPTILKRAERMYLLAGSNGSPRIAQELKERLISFWLSGLGVEKEQLSNDERILLTFLAGGVLSIVSEGEKFNPQNFAVASKDSLRECFVKTFSSIYKKRI